MPFGVGDWVIDSADPSRPGQYTGRYHPAGPHVMVEIRLPDGSAKFRPLQALRLRDSARQRRPGELLLAGDFGKLGDLQRLVTFEKLKGTLHEVLYSMEAAQVDFYPYQFKPVLKFIESPTERLVIADEVGLGKTIESMLIWLELVARRQAKRLLIVCPKILAEKWRLELRQKFLIEATIAGASDLARVIEEVKNTGPAHACVLIASYSGLRPPKSEVQVLQHAIDPEERVSEKTQILQRLRHWEGGTEPFDLVIFDEAHYMRNPATSTFHLGEALAASAGAVLCVSATPVNNRNTDLHSLLRLIDPDFFQTQGSFEALLDANRPTVAASNALSRTPIDVEALTTAIDGMRRSAYIEGSPLFEELVSVAGKAMRGDRAAAARCQALAEKLNLLGAYVTRTRRVQVKEQRPLREPLVLHVTYSPEERRLYDAIVDLVRRRCRANRTAFHIFHVIGLQLRAASCLPALAAELRKGRLGRSEEIVFEAFGAEGDEDDAVDGDGSEFDRETLRELLQYDFEKNDGKYRELRRLMLELVPEDKVVIFSYYKATLAYLRRRLAEDGVAVATIHGDMPNDERLEEIDRVRESPTRMALLSSEVGSEGLDLQFCRVVVNYDLPWNPMRVEQRIGRVDRVGQEAKRLSIVNLKITDTVEERLFNRLHEKLAIFSGSLGDLEEVVGQEVRHLTIQLFSQELTREEEERLMEQSRRVIEQRLLEVQSLEESGDALVSVSDYLQRQLEDDRNRGRFVQADELEDYVRDFFEREFLGCDLTFGSPAAGCVTIRLTAEASRSLNDFIGDDRTLAAQPFRRREFAVSFRREVAMTLAAEVKRRVAFANHLSPLIRWITSRHQARPETFHRASAVEVQTDLVPSGNYVYCMERWRFKGLATRERLAYSLSAIGNGVPTSDETAEAVLQDIRLHGRTWQYHEYDRSQVQQAAEECDRALAEGFGAATTGFENENRTTVQIRFQRVQAIFERRLAQDERRLETARQKGRSENVVRLMQNRILAAKEARDSKLDQLKASLEADYLRESVAGGIVRVVEPA